MILDRLGCWLPFIALSANTMRLSALPKLRWRDAIKSWRGMRATVRHWAMVPSPGHGWVSTSQQRSWMERALLVDPDNISMRYNFACTLANYINDKEAALEMLRPLFEQIGTGLINHTKIDPDLDS